MPTEQTLKNLIRLHPGEDQEASFRTGSCHTTYEPPRGKTNNVVSDQV